MHGVRFGHLPSTLGLGLVPTYMVLLALHPAHTKVALDDSVGPTSFLWLSINFA
jgi:hypothetical protein